MQKIEALPRRTFLAHLVSSSAFLIGARAGVLDFTGATTAERVSDADQAAWNPNVYLGIETDGRVILIMHRSEMGTGSRSVLPMVLAEELNADWRRVKLEQAIGDPKYGSQNTDGSCSIRDFYDTFREAGATARLMLERAAAQRWGVPAAECRAENHAVVHGPSRRQLGFGELALLARQQPVPKKEELTFKSRADYRYVGKDLPTADQDSLLNGTAIFGVDASLPGMVHASIERSPVFGGKLKGYDDRATKAVKGVLGTVTIPDLRGPTMFQPLGGVAVLATSTWAAAKGREKLSVEWTASPNAAYDSATFKASLIETVRQPQKVVRNVGDVDAALARATRTHEALYYAPHLAHAPMEPVAAVAEYKDGKVVCYANTQNPQAVQDTVAQALGIDKKNVECHVTLLGGGFGRKSKPDYVAEAALLSKSVGKPVKVIWSREDDIRFDYYHTFAAMYLKAGLDEKGKPNAWLQRVAYPSIGTTFNPAATHAEAFEMMMGWNDVPFDIPHHRAENGPAKNHVRIGWLRSVANIYQAFAIHSFVDELATLAKRDPVEYLLDLLGPARTLRLGSDYINHGKSQDDYPLDIGRYRHVLQLAAEKAGWGKKRPAPGRALGVAVHRSFLTYVAVVAEVEVGTGGRVRIPSMEIAVDAGTTINPDRVKSQFEGAGVFGASIALMSAITAKDGVIQQSNFHDYRVARMNEAPTQVNVHLVESTAPPAGVGEPGVPPVIPAICNAIAAATGKRIRELPVGRQLA